MAREITTHKINGCNGMLTIEVTDEPGSGGANHAYTISGFHTPTNPSAAKQGYGDETAVRLFFQNGPIAEGDTPNGITNENLLAILIDRLQGFQRGPFACEENGDALTYLELAMGALHSRTRDRLRRGVEGKLSL